MSSLIGAVSLTNRTGVFLGSVNLNNLNASPNELLYSPNGYDLEGLTVGDGLQISGGTTIETVGNPAIQLTSNSLYVNDNVSTIQSAVDASTQADTIFISSGSYGEPRIEITDKLNISLISPTQNGNGTICEILNGLAIQGTSERVRLSNLQLKGNSVEIKGVGRHRLTNLNVSGASAGTPLTLEIGKNSTEFMTFLDCEFNQFTNLIVSNLFASVVYFINCNFGSCSITLNNASPLQVIFNNCAGFATFPSTTACTFVGLNVLASGLTIQMNADRYVGVKSMVLAGGTDTLTSTGEVLLTGGTAGFSLAPLPTGITVANQADNRLITATATTDALNGEANLTFNGTTLVQGGINYNVALEGVQINDLAQNGNSNVAIGHRCRAQSSSVSIGYDIGRVGMSGTYNVLIGRSTATGLTTGNSVICIGGNAGQAITTGTGVVIVGTSSGAVQTTQSNITICGHNSRATDTAGVARANSGVFGDAIVNVLTGDNEIQIGKSTTTVYTYASATRSDARDKADIRDEELGLAFVEKLKPKQYRWDYRDDYTELDEDGNIVHLPQDGSKRRNRFHNGFIAQDVEATMAELGVDFAGLQHASVNGGTDVYHLKYDEFIAPLVKAVQELSAKVKLLEAKQ